MTRYLAGLITATAALGVGVWLLLAPYALNHPSGGAASKVDLWTGAGVCALSLATILVWVRAWRARLRADGLLPERPAPRPAVPDLPDEPFPAATAPTIEDLHGLLRPLVAALAADQLEHAGGKGSGATSGHTEEER
ncbi:hypothetical protein [Streptosporangium sp. NBC_01756]|uniref:hypothetical protein n=1 Tax=Streptosporangium sp. NBC_01756 TaxID=2975950 RepID=UPI002DD91931|nr:hypothetical protein [Streptosporangium sp. NBC_01756]WSC86018.1 hypothetical protein OIE48_37585 [Streptosporangium sp. NBC_01756]